MNLPAPARTLLSPVLLAVGAGALVVVPSHAQFVDITETSTGPAAPGVTYGLCWADFDLDGDPDAFVCRHYQRPIVFRNNGDGSVNYAFFPVLFDPAEDHHGGLIADFDQDGDPDIYLTGGADAGASTTPKKMYRNDGAFQFTDVAAEWGLEDGLARGRAASAMDVDGDGDVDLFVAKAARLASPNSLFLNDGNQQFTDVAAAAGLADDFGSVGGLWADYDHDGDPDLFISGEEEVTFETRLYRNEGGASFTDVTATALPGIGQVSAAAWGDYDNDGDLDLAACEGDRGLFDAIRWGPDSLFFFFNNRLGEDGLDGFGFTQTGDSAVFDLALDGFFQPDSVHISAQDLQPAFSPFGLHFDAIEDPPPFLPGQSTGFYLWSTSFLDRWNVHCSAPPQAGHTFAGLIRGNGQFISVDAVALEPYVSGPRGTRIWRNDGGTFTDVSAAALVHDGRNAHHVAWLDLDQDGWLDLYVLDKGDTSTLNAPNVLYRNRGGSTFEDATAVWALEGPAGGLGDAFAFDDFDLDGDLDVMFTSGAGPRFIAGMERVRLFRNDGPVGNRLRVHLQGVWSTREGHGAWVTCVSTKAGRQVRYVAGNNWRGGQQMLDPWFGLGPDSVADTVRVDWPAGGSDVFTNVSAGVITVVESHPLTDAPLASGPDIGPLGLVSRPNPATGGVVLAIRNRSTGGARVEIFDAGGRRILARDLPEGTSSLRWDGRDAAGRPAAAGVYFARCREGGRTAHAKIVRLDP